MSWILVFLKKMSVEHAVVQLGMIPTRDFVSIKTDNMRGIRLCNCLYHPKECSRIVNRYFSLPDLVCYFWCFHELTRND